MRSHPSRVTIVTRCGNRLRSIIKLPIRGSIGAAAPRVALLSYKSQPPILPVRCEKMRVAREMLPRDERHRKEKAKAKASGAETKTVARARGRGSCNTGRIRLA